MFTSTSYALPTSLRILLIDDDSNYRTLFRAYILRMLVPAPLECAGTFAEGLERLLEGDFDIGLVDYRLGPDSGIDLIRTAMAQGCRTPLIVLTGDSNHEVDLEAMSAGAADYLIKGEFDLRLLERSIRYAIERNRMLHRLWLKKEHLRVILAGAPIILFTCDGDGVITLVEGKDLDIVGLRADDFIGRSSFDAFRDNPVIIDAVTRVLRGETVDATVPWGERTFHARYLPWVDAGGKPNGFIGVATDITDRIRSERQLQQAERHFRALIEKCWEAIALIDIDSTITYSTPGVQRILGYVPSEIVGQSSFELVYPDDRPVILEAIELMMKTPGSASSAEYRFRHADGSYRWLESTWTNLLDEPAVGAIVCNYRDITERKLADEALREAHDRLEVRVQERTAELVRALDRLEQAQLQQKQFIADASHDLRTPLTVIRAEIDLLLQQNTLDSETHGLLEKVSIESRKIETLTTDMLTLAKIDAQQTTDNSVVVRLDELLLDCIASFSTLARQKEIAWNINIDAGTEIRCEESLVRRAITNVVENAVKYTHTAGQIVVSLRSVADKAIICIADNGPGIAVDELPYVFDRFYRCDSTRSTPGTGLGLSIVKGVVDLYGGTVTLSSTIGVGTTVALVFERLEPIPPDIMEQLSPCTG